MKSRIKALGEIALRVNDLDPMVDYYQNKIGLELIRREGDVFAFFKIAEGFAGHTTVLAMFDRNKATPQNESYTAPLAKHTSVDHIAFTIDKSDFELEDERLKNLGLKITYAYHDWVQWRSLYVTDPEGNVVELVCYDPEFNKQQ